MLRTQQLYVGLSARGFVQRCRQRALVLFKLLLLERKVLFMQSPVSELCSFFLTLLSLHPGMLEDGLGEAARMVPADTPPSASPSPDGKVDDRESEDEGGDGEAPVEKGEEAVPKDDDDTGSIISNAGSIAEMAEEKLNSVKGKLTGALGYIAGYKTATADGQAEVPAAEQEVDGAEAAIPVAPNFATVANMTSSDLGLPLNIFTGGNLCHPYLSLSYLDILCQPSIHGYMIGATNILFKQKRGIAEVVVEMESDKTEVQDPELKKALNLTTEDLRFVDNVIKHVSEESSDAFLDGVGWEGGDEWVRAQFRDAIHKSYTVPFHKFCKPKSLDQVYRVTKKNGKNLQFTQIWEIPPSCLGSR